ncbi:MAG: CotH kinase family protein [Fluviicola sp.]
MSFSTNAQLTINELLVRNGGLYLDEDGDCSAILELYNTSPDYVQLADYYLSDRSTDLGKWRFPNDLLAPNQRTIVYLSNKNRVSPLHANFSLSVDENLYLSTENGFLIEVVDSIVNQEYPYNASICRFPDGTGNFVYSSSTINSANIDGESTLVPTTTISINSGVYPIGTNFTVSNATSLTSLNGKEVSFGGQIGTNFTIPDPYVSALHFSIIPTNPSLTYPVGDYSESRANDRGWLPPTSNQPRISIIRNQLILPSGMKSEEQVRSVFTSQPTFGLPIISLIVDSVGYFDPEKGISVYGNHPDGNYNFRGRISERLVQMHFFDSLGNLTYETSAGLRIKGNGSRHSSMKSMRFIQRDIYPGTIGNDSTFLSKYSLMRSGGHRPDCFGRDYLSHLFVQNLSFLKAKPQLHASYLNGEFWGIYDMRPNLDEKYIEFLYDLPKETSAIADHTYIIQTEERADSLEFSELTLFAQNNDLTLPENFAYMQQKLDFTDFIGVNCAHIFLGNGDYPRTNNAWFNVENGSVSSKWKNLFFDLDGGFGGDCDTILRTFNTLNYYLQTTSTNWIKSTRLLRNLVNNPLFVKEFANTMADFLNSSFRKEALVEKYNSYTSELEPNRLLQVERWGYPSTSETLIDRYSETPSLQKWDELTIALEDYFSSRQRFVYRHFMNRFLFEDTARFTIDNSLSNSGYVQINSLLLSDKTDGFTTYPWNGLYFKGVPIELTAFSKKGFRFESWSNGLNTSSIAIDLNSDSLITANFISDPSFQNPHINEVLTNNAWGEIDQYAQREAWIEIYNPNAFPISLDGYYLSDDLSNLTKYKLIPVKEHTVLANGYTLFYASNVSARGKHHCNFKLSDNETIYLVDTDGSTILEQLTIPTLPEDFSYGSSPNGSSTYVEFSDPTPRLNNNETGIEDLEKHLFTVFPNPTNTIVELSKYGNYSLYSLNGLKLKSIENANQIDLSELTTGIYLIKNERGAVQRIVKL